MSKAFGEQTPTLGEDPVSWQTWSDGAGGIPEIVGNADWGKLKLDYFPGEEGRSAVYDLGSAKVRKFTLTENRYGTGSEDAVLQYRVDTISFLQDDVLPAWTNYSVPFSVNCRYVQVRETTLAFKFVDATNGNDGWAGTFAAPWKTIQYGVNHIAAGDTLLIRGGTYIERVVITVTGTISAPIVISGFPSETVIVDGNATYPVGVGSGLIDFRSNASHITLKDIGVTNVNHINYTAGVWVTSGCNYITIDNVDVYETWGSGIILQGNYGVAQNCLVYHTNLSNYQNNLGSWGGSIQASGDYPTVVPSNNIIKNCYVFENWGEGINIFESDHTTVQACVSYNNFSVDIYISDCQNALVQRNIAYKTSDSVTSGWGQIQNAIVINEEGHWENQDNTIVNNFCLNDGGYSAMWIATDACKNNLIAYNTMVNGGNGFGALHVWTNATCDTGCIVKNNIIMQENPLSDCITGGGAVSAGISWSYNFFSKMPSTSYVKGTGDIYDDDPELAKTGGKAAGVLSGIWFRLPVTSPAIGAGNAISGITEDYFETIRDANPDMGGHEYT